MELELELELELDTELELERVVLELELGSWVSWPSQQTVLRGISVTRCRLRLLRKDLIVQEELARKAIFDIGIDGSCSMVTVSPEQYNVPTVIRKFNELLVAFLIVSIFLKILYRHNSNQTIQ